MSIDETENVFDIIELRVKHESLECQKWKMSTNKRTDFIIKKR